MLVLTNRIVVDDGKFIWTTYRMIGFREIRYKVTAVADSCRNPAGRTERCWYRRVRLRHMYRRAGVVVVIQLRKTCGGRVRRRRRRWSVGGFMRRRAGWQVVAVGGRVVLWRGRPSWVNCAHRRTSSHRRNRYWPAAAAATAIALRHGTDALTWICMPVARKLTQVVQYQSATWTQVTR